MALPGSGQMTASMIRAEFGGPTQFVISDYYRGGGLVPNVSENNSVPTSGQISFGDFYGATAEEVTVSGSGPILSGNFTVGVRFNSDGTVDAIANGGTTQLSPSTDWIIPNSAAPGGYEVRALLASGTAPDGGNSLSNWHSASISPVWTHSAPPQGQSINFELTISVRDASGTILDFGSYPCEVQSA